MSTPYNYKMNTRNNKIVKTKIPSCACLNHITFTANCGNSPLRGRAWFKRRKEFAELKKRGLVDRRAAHICVSCLNYGREKAIQCTARSTQESENAQSDDGISDEDTFDDDRESDDGQTDGGDMDMDVDDDERPIINHPENPVPDEQPPVENDLKSEIDRLTMRISSMKWESLSDDLKSSLSSLAKGIGKVIRSDIDNEKYQMAAECKNFET